MWHHYDEASCQQKVAFQWGQFQKISDVVEEVTNGWNYSDESSFLGMVGGPCYFPLCVYMVCLDT